jgi:PAS domain-containing protein
MFELFENASEGMLLIDRDARVVWINEQYRRFLPALGFAREEDFVGQPVARWWTTRRCTRCCAPASRS